MRDDEPRPVKGGCPRHRDDTIVRACRVRCLLFSTREIAMTAAKSLPALFLLSPALLRAELLPCSREQSCCLASKTARKTVLFLFVPGLSLSPIIPLPPPFPVAGPLTRLHKHAALPAGEEASVGRGSTDAFPPGEKVLLGQGEHETLPATSLYVPVQRRQASRAISCPFPPSQVALTALHKHLPHYTSMLGSRRSRQARRSCWGSCRSWR
jgi:hypothetical protein